MTRMPCRPPRRLMAFLAFAGMTAALNGLGAAQQPAGGEKPQPTPKITLPDSWVKTLQWRCVGPANMGGRITSLSVYEADPTTYYAATASGGLLKTANASTTFDHQFDKETTVSIGAVCVAPSNPNVVWVGTGENNPRNSVSYGDGVYKSTDGGKTWKNMGLKGTFQIGDIVIHPTNPDVVYVGALGRLYGPNPERGLFKTADGGKTWSKILYTDASTGVIDISMNPKDPDDLLVAMWERKRDEFDNHLEKNLPDVYDSYDPVIRFGPTSGIYRTTDGGKTFKKATEGLPTNKIGRVGIDHYGKDPKVVYAVIDCEKIGMGTKKGFTGEAGAFLGMQGEDADPGPGAKLTRITPGGPAEAAGLKVDDVILVVGAKKIAGYDALTEDLGQRKPGDKVEFRIRRDKEDKTIAVTLGERPAGGFGGGGGGGGATKARPYRSQLGGQIANAQDQQGPDAHEYGGIYKSTDGGTSWKRVNSLNQRPMYFGVVKVDPSDSKYVYSLGVQLHVSRDGGATFGTGGKGTHADHHAMWINPRDGRHQILGNDGGTYVTYDRGNNWDHLNHMALAQFYHVAVCTKKPYWVYGGLQDNGSWGGPSRGLRGGGFGPAGGGGPVNQDWLSIGGGDGFVCRVDPTDPDLIYSESQNGNIRRRHLKTGEQAGIRPQREKGLPAYRFNWNTPFLLSNHNPKIFYSAGNYVFKSLNRGDNLKEISPEITQAKGGSATALAESPKNADVLWVGTDCGALWVTRDGGKKWDNVTGKVGLKGPLCVGTIEASRFADGRAYVCYDGHRSNDDKPYVFMTDDFGQTWRPINANLPAFGSTRCLREDVTNPDLLYCGTEFNVFASINRGESWTKVNNNLPTVAVHEIAVHPTAGEIVAATHGRSLWILDVSALRQVKAATVTAQAHLYKPHDAVQWRPQPTTGGTNRKFVGTNPPAGAQIYFSLAEPAQSAKLQIYDINNKVVREETAPTGAGLHRVGWNFTRTAAAGKGVGGGKGGGKGGGVKGGGKGGPGGPGGFQEALAPAGEYRAVLTVDGREYAQSFRVEADPNVPAISGRAEDEEILPDVRRDDM